MVIFSGRLFARSLAVPWGGRLGVALLAVAPTLLAHASLATKDIAITACLAAFVYHYRTGRDSGWLKRVGLPALWFALTLLSKASGVVFCPLCMLALEAERLARLGAFSLADAGVARARWRQWLSRIHQLFQPFRRDAVQTLAIGMVLVVIYCGSDWQPQQSCVRWAHGLPEGPFASTMIWTTEHVCIFRNAGDAIARQVSHHIR